MFNRPRSQGVLSEMCGIAGGRVIMRKIRQSKWQCLSCGWLGKDDHLLTAKSPFRDDDILTACPECKMNGGFRELCDIDGCLKEAACGTPVKDGFATFSGDDSSDDYLRTCGAHRPKKRGES